MGTPRESHQLVGHQEGPSVDRQGSAYALSVSTSQTIGMSRNEITVPICQIMLQNAMKLQLKQTSAQWDDGVNKLQNLLWWHRRKQTVKNEFRGIPWTGVYEVRSTQNRKNSEQHIKESNHRSTLRLHQHMGLAKIKGLLVKRQIMKAPLRTYRQGGAWAMRLMKFSEEW